MSNPSLDSGSAAQHRLPHLLAQEWRDLRPSGVRSATGDLEEPSARHCEPAGAGEAIHFQQSFRQMDRVAALAMTRFSRSAISLAVLAAVLGFATEGLLWTTARGLPFSMLTERWSYMLGIAEPPLPSVAAVREGTFPMGSERAADSQPSHPVSFSRPVYLGSVEVTFREWDACVADDGCNGYLPTDQDWGRHRRPVVNVSWRDAQSYLAWLRKRGADCRLPSEAEWEYAARAGTTKEYALPAPDGSDDIEGKSLANCADCGSAWDGDRTAPVGNFPANAWGLRDMHGNVFEWVEDCWHANYEGAPADGRAWREEEAGNCPRVLRGGSWNVNRDFAGSASRFWNHPDLRYDYVGLRVACSSPIGR